MSHQPPETFFSTATNIAGELGLQFSIYRAGNQIIAFPPERSFHLRFAPADGVAKAIAVEFVDEQGTPVTDSPDTPVYLLATDLPTNVAAHLIQHDFIDSYLANPSAFLLAL